MSESNETGGPRRWRRFLSEFVMIAIAVFVGSMGEYWLDHAMTNERRDESLTLMLRNLESDRRNIDTVLAYADRGVAYLNRSKLRAHALRTRAITSDVYLRGLVEDLPNSYSYRTFFMDPAAFTAMSTAGLVSTVESQALKSELSIYYEVLRQRLEDNNRLVDAEGQAYYHYALPLQNTVRDPGVEIANRLAEDADVAFYLTLPSVQAKLVSDDYIIDTDNLLLRAADYRALLQRIRAQNVKLDALIRASL